MTPEEFGKNFYKEHQHLINLYFDEQGQTDVWKMIQSLNLDEKKLETLKEILMSTLRDAFYTTLLGLDGSAKIGERQEIYRLTDEGGNELTGGEIESFAWEYFHNTKISS